MIKHLANTVIKRNILSFQCFNPYLNFRSMHFFSDNNKRDPFSKFKRGSNAHKNTDKAQKKVQGHQQKKESNSHLQRQNQQGQKTNFTNNKQSNIPAKGFNKFKRVENVDSKTKVNFQSQQGEKEVENEAKPKEQNSEEVDSKKVNKQEVNQKNQSVLNSQSNPNIETNNDNAKAKQHINIKGFAKYKKVQAGKDQPIKMKKQNVEKSVQSNTNVEQTQKQANKEQNILNSNTNDDSEKENIKQNTQHKIKEDTEEWENFLKDQIKKEKTKKQGEAQQWKTHDFTSARKKQQENQEKQKSQGFQPPKSPFEAMKMLFFGGIGVYLGSLLITELFHIDKSKLVETEQMLNLLKSGNIVSTWFFTSVQNLTEESSRTKKFVCVALSNGQTYKCSSNNDFEIEWNKLVDQFNTASSLSGSNQFIVKQAPIIKKDSHIFNSVRSLLSFVLLFMFIRSIMGGVSKGKGQMGKGGGLSGLFQNSKSHRFRQNITVKFDDVVGMNKAKEEIVQFIDFLKNAEKYNRLGAKIPRGALLTGPPGTGKTMLAKACAGESGVPFFTISGSQFMQMYVGVGAQRVRNLFTQAKQTAPSIIFIDQIDAVGKKRSSGSGGGGNDERDNTLNQLLVEMDGFDQTTNVIVFAATNQKQVLDPALTRPGRFDRLIEVDLPDIEGRRQIFLVHLKPITLDEKYQMEDYAKRLATLTPGFSGADIKNLCNQAAIIAARGDKKFVSMIDFQLASQRIIGGVEKKSTLITPETKRTVAYHECGHGVVSWFMEHASPLLKLTIIPRSKGALGFAQYLPNENQVYSRKQLQDQICVILGGRIAQQIFFQKISTGASDDLQKAHKVAKSIITEYGMGKSLSWLSYGQTQYAKQYSHMTEEKIDEEIFQIIEECSKKTRLIIQEKKDKIQNLAQLLLKQETIDQRMIQGVLGQRPFKSSKQYEEYIREKNKLDKQDQKQSLQVVSEEKTAFKGISLNRIMTAAKTSKIKMLQYI